MNPRSWPARAAAAWRGFLFGPEPALSLAACRIAFYGYLFYKYRGLDTAAWSAFSPTLWFPMPLFSALGLGIASPGVLVVLDLLFKLALACACAGLLTRTSSVAALVLGLYLLGLPHNFGKVHHSDAQLVFIMLAMALSRSGDHLSIDALLRRRRGLPSAPLLSGEYRFPIRVAWLAWVIVYFAAGVAKLRHSGLSWVSGADMQNRLLLHQYTHAPPTDWGVWVASVPALCTAIAAGALLIELAAPLALVSRRARLAFIPALGGMQLGIYLLLGVKFGGFVAAYLFWLPWVGLVRLLLPARWYARLQPEAPTGR